MRVATFLAALGIVFGVQFLVVLSTARGGDGPGPLVEKDVKKIEQQRLKPVWALMPKDGCFHLNGGSATFSYMLTSKKYYRTAAFSSFDAKFVYYLESGKEGRLWAFSIDELKSKSIWYWAEADKKWYQFGSAEPVPGE